MSEKKFVDLDNKIVKLRMKALSIGLADQIASYVLAFN
jgi:hypothetical protein